MKICYGSYNRQVQPEKREALARVMGQKLAQGLKDKLGAAPEVICCSTREDVAKAAASGCDLILTESQLKLPNGGKPGDDNVGYGTIKEWTSMHGVKRVVLLMQAGDRPSVADKDGKPSIVTGRKLVELFRRGYYDALFYNDLQMDKIAALLSAGRTEEEAKAYYGITDQMLEILLATSKPEKADKAEGKAKEEKKSLFGGLFGGKKKEEKYEAEAERKEEKETRTEDKTEQVSSNNNVASATGDKKEVKKDEEPSKKEESADEVKPFEIPRDQPKEERHEPEGPAVSEEELARAREQANSDVMKALLSGGTDSFFEDEEEQEPAAEPESGGFDFGFGFEREETKKPETAGGGFGFEFEELPPVEKPKAPMPDAARTEEVRAEEAKAEEVKTREVIEEVKPVMENANVANVTENGAEETSVGVISSCLNEGTLLTVDVASLPSDPDVTRYSAMILVKGAGRGRVVNGRWVSSVKCFTGYCVKVIMQRTVLVEVPDGDTPGPEVEGKQCMITFYKLA